MPAVAASAGADGYALVPFGQIFKLTCTLCSCINQALCRHHASRGAAVGVIVEVTIGFDILQPKPLRFLKLIFSGCIKFRHQSFVARIQAPVLYFVFVVDAFENGRINGACFCDAVIERRAKFDTASTSWREL